MRERNDGKSRLIESLPHDAKKDLRGKLSDGEVSALKPVVFAIPRHRVKSDRIDL
jgi:hypothetical protein